VDSALWLLLILRFKGWLRRFGRSLGSVKGILLTLLGMVFFLPWLISMMSAGSPMVAGHPETAHYLASVRRFGPLALLAYCLISLFLSSGDRAIYFSPAEVNFLFPAPFSRRKLLGYKIATSLGITLLSAAFMTVFFKGTAVWWVATYVGLVLALMFFQLFAMAIALVGANVGALAFTWRRRFALGFLLFLVAAGCWQAGGDLFDLPPAQLLAKVEQSPLVQAVLAPFRWFVLTYTSERLWPDLVQWASLALAVDLGLVVFVLALDAQYLESSAAASARIYSALEQRRRGGGAVSRRSSGRARFSLPALPWWGGAGPIAWLQITSALRRPARMVASLLLSGTFAAGFILSLSRSDHDPEFVRIAASMVFLISMFLTQGVPFDFRADIDQMAELKALPISPLRMALGQLVTPVAYITLLQWFILAAIGVASGRAEPFLWATAGFALVVNMLLLEIENAVFLWFPTRTAARSPGDIQRSGRAVLLMLAKVLCLGLTGGFAFLVAAAVYFLLGKNVAAAAVAGWFVLTCEAIGLVTLVALAFEQFDVARDVPA
jgi:Putative ABC exporter